MKIVHIHQYYNDGMGYQENILPQYQVELGHEVILITSNLSNGFNNENRVKSIGEYKDNNFIIKRINTKGEFKNRFVIFNELYKYLEELKPDYIFHHSVTSPSLGIVCRYKKKNPSIFLAVDNHADLNISARNKVWKFLYYNTFWKSYIKKYDKFIDLYFGITPSRCLFLKEELGVSVEKIRLLPIGTDIKKIKKTISKKELFSKYNINENNFNIVHGGKITPEKQIDRIVEAFSLIKDNNINLILFGKIQDKKVKKLIENDKRIISLGWLNREETLSILKYSDLGIWNTQHTTLLEDSIAVGLPMILRYYGSTSHLIDNSGLYLYQGSVREIYDKMNFIINNREVLEKFKTNSRRMSQLLSYENIAKESVLYSQDTKSNKIHEKFMSETYSDAKYVNFRVMNKK